MDIVLWNLDSNVSSDFYNKTHLNVIPRYDENASYNDVFRNVIFANIPCIITGVTEDWSSLLNWTKDSNINFEYLSEMYGSQMVPVVDCDITKHKCHERKDMLLSEWIKQLMKREHEIPGHVTYLKDWHLKRENPKDNFYSVPKYFASDWLNEYCIDCSKDDYMFVYIGPKHSWTPFHEDVYSSFSWSANVIGEKEWFIFPPQEEEKLKDVNGEFPLDVRNSLSADIQYFHIIQKSGDTIFIPSGWYHQVHNTKDTISINHNWINGCNIVRVWQALCYNFKLVQNEIREFDESEDWAEQCQLILKNVFGMDHKDFFRFLIHIARKRIHQYNSCEQIKFDKWELGQNQIKFDLNRINATLKLICQDTTFDDTIHEELCNIHREVRLIVN